MRGWLKAAVAALIASIAWIAANMAWPNLADWYARAVYPTLLAIAGGASARIAMPAAEVLALLLALLFAASTLAAPLRALFTRSLGPLKVWLVRMLCGLAAAIALYAALWAPLYSRTEPIDAGAATRPQLEALCDRLIEGVNGLRSSAREDWRGLYALDIDDHAMLIRARELIADATGMPVQSPKSARYPELLSAMGASGMYFPWTFEALVSPNDLDSARPFTALHEAAHMAGYAREQDANYVAWLAAERAEPAFRYSADLGMLLYAMEQLHDVDAQSWHFRVLALSGGVERDFRASGGYRGAEGDTARRAWDGVADAFLRLNGQATGLVSYGDAVRLAIAHLEHG